MQVSTIHISNGNFLTGVHDRMSLYLEAAGSPPIIVPTDAFESKTITLDPELQRRLERNAKAWTFIQTQPAGYRYLTTFYVMSAKQDATRVKRLDTLIAYWAAGKRDR